VCASAENLQNFLNLFVSREYGSGCKQKKAPRCASATHVARQTTSGNVYDNSFKMGHFSCFSKKKKITAKSMILGFYPSKIKKLILAILH